VKRRSSRFVPASRSPDCYADLSSYLPCHSSSSQQLSICTLIDQRIDGPSSSLHMSRRTASTPSAAHTSHAKANLQCLCLNPPRKANPRQTMTCMLRILSPSLRLCPQYSPRKIFHKTGSLFFIANKIDSATLAHPPKSKPIGKYVPPMI